MSVIEQPVSERTDGPAGDAAPSGMQGAAAESAHRRSFPEPECDCPELCLLDHAN
jgi:hypothetical protein